MGPRTEAGPWPLPTLADPQVALGSPGLRGPSGAGAELESSNCPFMRDQPAGRRRARVQEETADGGRGPRPPERRSWRWSGRDGGTPGRGGEWAAWPGRVQCPPSPAFLWGPEAGLAAQGTPEPRACGQRQGGGREEQTAQLNMACGLQVGGGVQGCFLKMGPHFPVRWGGGWPSG